MSEIVPQPEKPTLTRDLEELGIWIEAMFRWHKATAHAEPVPIDPPSVPVAATKEWWAAILPVVAPVAVAAAAEPAVVEPAEPAAPTESIEPTTTSEPAHEATAAAAAAMEPTEAAAVPMA